MFINKFKNKNKNKTLALYLQTCIVISNNICFHLFFIVELEICENFYALDILILIYSTMIDLLQKLDSESILEQ